MTKIILASSSPRRKQLMNMLNIPFEIIKANINEEIDTTKNIIEEIEKLSFLKALDVFNKNKDAIVIGSDTIVEIGGKVLGKPKNINNAKEMLNILQGNKHRVITSVSIISNKQSETFSNISEVFFEILTNDEIDEYIQTNEPMDKAGAYAIQGIGAKYIKKINGDFYSIMGLPINELNKRLKKYL